MSEQNSDNNPAGGSQSLSHSNSDDDGVNSVTKGNLRWKWNEFPIVSRYNLFFLGLSFVVGSVIDVEFSGGYWILLFNTFLMGIGYLLLTSSLAEMTSALPFSGGIYGIVRAFLHPFAGFYVACFELLINIFYIAFAMRSLTLMPIQADVISEDNFIFLSLAIHIVVLIVVLLDGKIFWLSNLAICVASLVFILIYILGSIQYANFPRWKHSDKDFTISGVMRYMIDPSLTYLGVQFLPLASKLVPEARKDVPYAMMGTVMVIFPLILAVITIACSIPPGYDKLALEDHPLIFGYSRILGTTTQFAHFFGLPGLLSTCFSFTYCFGRQASTMAGSCLLPPCFTWTLRGFGTPYVALITVTVLSFLLNLLNHLVVTSDLYEVYQSICCLSTYVVFIAFFCAYIRFVDHYSSLHRYYYSPFGKIGAFLGIGIFGLCLVSALGFQDSGYLAISVLGGLSILIWFIFRCVLKGNHEYSEEEKNELFKAYLITANKSRNKQRFRKKATEVIHNSNSNSNSFSFPKGLFAFSPTKMNSSYRLARGVFSSSSSLEDQKGEVEENTQQLQLPPINEQHLENDARSEKLEQLPPGSSDSSKTPVIRREILEQFPPESSDSIETPVVHCENIPKEPCESPKAPVFRSVKIHP